MRSFVSGTDLSIRVVFEIEREPVVPDVGSVFYTIYGNVGSSLAGYTNIAVTTTADTTQICVLAPAAINAKVLFFENRTVSVTFKVLGQTTIINVPYRLIDRIPMAVDANAARALIGIAPNELPDEDIDLPMAYYLLAGEVTQATLDAALIVGSTKTYAANRAIVCRALLELLPSLQLRVNQNEKSQTASASRLAQIDFKKVERWLTDLYALAKLTIIAGTQTVMPFMELATPVDTITGV